MSGKAQVILVSLINFVFDNIGYRGRTDIVFELQLFLPELLFQSRCFDLTAPEFIKFAILRPAEINRGQRNKENNKNNKNVTI